MATWPSSLPTPDWGIDDDVYRPQIKTEFEANYGQSRPSVTRSRGKWPLGWGLLSEAEYQVLRAFFVANQGNSFTWPHPISGTNYTCRFSADVLKSKWKSAGWRSDVQCPIEEV